MQPLTLKTIRVHAHGGPEVLRLEELPLPVPGPGQILVAVKAAGVNLFDTQLRSGLYKRDLPVMLGQEGAGIVEAVGPGVADMTRGRPRRLDLRARILRHPCAGVRRARRAAAGGDRL